MIQIIREYPCNIREIVKKTHENGETKLAIASKGVMFGIPRFYRECVNYNIQPVIGCEFPLENNKSITLFDMFPLEVTKKLSFNSEALDLIPSKAFREYLLSNEYVQENEIIF